MNWTIVVAFVAALAAPLLGYLAAARRLSGKIQTSEASSLWQEASNLRQEYRDEVRLLRGQLEECLSRIKLVEETNSKLRTENGGLNKIVKEQQEEIEELKAVVIHLEADNKALRLRVLELETINGNRDQ